MKRVLLIDTDEAVTLTKAAFRDQFGTQLLFARDLAAALEIMKTHEIGLIISGPHFDAQHFPAEVSFFERPLEHEKLADHIRQYLRDPY